MLKFVEEKELGLSDDLATRIGQGIGTIGNDLTQDHSRGAWWLLNAPQALGNIVTEEVLNKVNPDLFHSRRDSYSRWT